MSRPVSFRRFDRDGVAVDLFPQPLSNDGANMLLNVWAGRLQRGEYSRIELRLINGGLATLKRLKAF